MTKSDNWQYISRKIVTIEDLHQIKMELDKYRRSHYKLNRKNTKNQFSALFLEILANISRDAKVKNRQKLKILEEFLDYLEKCVKIKLELAFNPSIDFLKKIALELEKIIKSKVILNIIVKEELIAGAIIEYNGRYYDFSLRSKLDKHLAAAFDQI